ncbi:hypothetical protein D3C76_1257490 [compost metagenome]
MADLGQELGLRIDLGGTGRQGSAGAETGFGHAAQALADGAVEQPATDAGKCQQDKQQPLGRRAGQAEQGGQYHQAAEVENQHGHAEQSRWRVTFLPVIGTDRQHAQAAKGDQGIGNEVQRQGFDEQQQQAAHSDQEHFVEQHAIEQHLPARGKKAQGEHQAGQGGQQGSEVGRRGLRRMPQRQPWSAEVEQDQGTAK